MLHVTVMDSTATNRVYGTKAYNSCSSRWLPFRVLKDMQVIAHIGIDHALNMNPVDRALNPAIQKPGDLAHVTKRQTSKLPSFKPFRSQSRT